jgi:hypothetical protein
MIGHIALFIAALVAASVAALGFPSRTESETCPAAVQTSTNVYEHGIAVGHRSFVHARSTARRSC